MNINKLQTGTDGLFRQDTIHQAEQENMRIQKSKAEKAALSKPQQTGEGDNVSVSKVWQRVADDIDVKNATPRDIIALSRTLYRAGAISYDDHINLSFQPEVNPDTPAQGNSFSHERKDYIALWRVRQENVIRSGGDREQIEDTHRIQAILTYVNSLR